MSVDDLLFYGLFLAVPLLVWVTACLRGPVWYRRVVTALFAVWALSCGVFFGLDALCQGGWLFGYNSCQMISVPLAHALSFTALFAFPACTAAWAIATLIAFVQFFRGRSGSSAEA